jgi:chromosomal replication initiation ATPase DnaA
MTPEEALKEIKDYFNLELLPYSRQRLFSILEMLDKTKTITKIKKVYVYSDNEVQHQENRLDLVEEAQRIAHMYDTSLHEMKGRRRFVNIVSARAHFCRYAKLNSDISLSELGRFLRRDHTSIMHLIYNSKQRCIIPPLPRKIRKK